MGAPKESYVKRARMSANAGPYLFLAGAILMGAALFLGPLHIAFVSVMALSALLLQIPRQKAWLSQNDMLEFASLAAMPVLIVVLAFVWLKPAGVLSTSIILQGLGGFFLALGAFHMLAKSHTLRLADRIERGD